MHHLLFSNSSRTMTKKTKANDFDLENYLISFFFIKIFKKHPSRFNKPINSSLKHLVKLFLLNEIY